MFTNDKHFNKMFKNVVFVIFMGIVFRLALACQ